MAERVHQLMEQMVPELEDFRRKNLFNQDEIRSIVKKRSYFERLLNRRAPQRADFLRAIQYEMNLDLLRKHRKKKPGAIKKRGVSDTSISRRISFIYDRAVRRFRGDIKLWLQYLDHCIAMGATRTLKSTFARALQLMPTQASLWVRAARYEFERNHHADAARVLFQQGLRFNRSSQLLWLEFLRMELQFSRTLLQRKRVLGLADKADKEKGKAEAGEGKEEGEKEGDEEEGGESKKSKDAEMESEGSEGSAPAEPAQDLSFAIAIPRAIFKRALEAGRHDLSFRARMLNLVAREPAFSALREEMVASLREELADKEECWEYLATRTTASVSDAIAVFEEGCSRLASPSMWERFISFLSKTLEQAPEGEQRDLLTQKLIDTCAKAHAMGHMTEACACIWIMALLQAGNIDEASRVSELSCQQFPRSVRVLQLSSQMLTRRTLPSSSHDQFHEVTQLLQSGAERVGGPDSEPLWVSLIELVVATQGEAGKDTQELEALFQSALASVAKAGASEALERLRLMYIDWAMLSGGISLCRRAVRSVLASTLPASLPVIRRCVQLESAQPQPDRRAVQDMFERAVAVHGATADDLWIDYIQFASRHEDFPLAAQLHSRALKALEEPASFIAKYERIK